MYYNYNFCVRQSAELEQALKELDIHYDVSDYGSLVPTLISFTIRDNIEKVANISALTKHKPIVTAVYTRSEIERAKLLWLWPKKQNIEITNRAQAFTYTCSYTCSYGNRVHHEKQVAPLHIARQPSYKGNCAFWCEDTVFAQLFTDIRVRKIVEANSLTGFVFHDVILKNGSRAENIFQLGSTAVLPIEAIATGYGEIANTCPFCGKVQFEHDNKYQLHLRSDVVASCSDFYMTEDFWGPGIGRPLYIISQRFYQHLINNKLTDGITVSPVVIQ